MTRRTRKAKSDHQDRTARSKTLRFTLVVSIFAFMSINSSITILIYALLRQLIPGLVTNHRDPLLTGIATLIACTIIGTILSGFLFNRVLRPLNEMIRATKEIAKGNYKVQIQETFDPDSDFGRLQHSFNHMTQELDSVELLRNDFINNFSHEFKTPIVSIRGFAHQLQAGGLTEAEQKEYIAIIASESDRLTKMATSILLLSKLENQQIITDMTEFYLDEQIRTCWLLLERQWTAKNIELDIDLDEARYLFNEDMLSHVWLNLFENAIKFTPDDGLIACTLRRETDALVVTVRDTGCGMDSETREHIFEKFYQGDTSHSGKGNGIGLTIVSRIVELCGGLITVDSQPGMGSTFTIRLPIHA